jgi:hypothetical protein
VWGGASGYTYTFGRSSDGATDVNVVIVRQGKNAAGRPRHATTERPTDDQHVA